ncbi:MAG: hypothetical protein JW702_09455 [Clostridiales bacterium]|nr:hypothetical protein [Clostridiales bacterium]
MIEKVIDVDFSTKIRSLQQIKKAFHRLRNNSVTLHKKEKNETHETY